jgi:hypothetical protein
MSGILDLAPGTHTISMLGGRIGDVRAVFGGQFNPTALRGFLTVIILKQ